MLTTGISFVHLITTRVYIPILSSHTLISPLLCTLSMNNLKTKKHLQLQLLTVLYQTRVLLDLPLQSIMMENNFCIAMVNQWGLILKPFVPKFAPLLQQWNWFLFLLNIMTIYTIPKRKSRHNFRFITTVYLKSRSLIEWISIHLLLLKWHYMLNGIFSQLFMKL